MSSLQDELDAKGQAQVIVVLKPQARTSLSMAMGARKPVGAVITSGELSKYFLAPSHGTALAAARGVAPPAAGVRFYPNLGLALGTVNKAGLAGLKSEKTRVEDVVHAPVLRPIRPVRVAAVAPPKQVVTWGITALKIPALWKKGLTGKGVLVGHLDTGADGRHPALKPAIKAFAEFDLMGRQVNPAPGAHDSDDATPGHGTHTAATIAGRPVRGKNVGVAPEAMLASALVIEGGDVVARILGGMDWAVGLEVRVLSMSLGLPGFSDSFETITQILRARNVLPVFAIGNEGPGTSRSPGNYVEALSVGASSKSKKVADFSSSDQFNRPGDPTVPDIVAPGVKIISAKVNGGYQEMDGTSMATPHIAGLAALLIQAKPTAKPDQIERAIYASCTPLPGTPEERQGRGVPDAVKALKAL